MVTKRTRAAEAETIESEPAALTVTVRPRVPAESVPEGSRAFSCPGCGAPYIAIPPAPVQPNASLQFDFACRNPECKGGAGGTQYKAGLGIA